MKIEKDKSAEDWYKCSFKGIVGYGTTRENAIEDWVRAMEGEKMCVCGDSENHHVDNCEQCFIGDCGCKEFDMVDVREDLTVMELLNNLKV